MAHQNDAQTRAGRGKARQPGRLEQALSALAPQWGLRRSLARARLEMLGALGVPTGYGNHGASRRANWAKGWDDRAGDATRDIASNLPTLRARARDLDAGGGMARAALRTIRTNVVGGGLTVRPRMDVDALGWTDARAREWQKHTRREFEMWADSKACDADRLMNFYELQQLLQLSWMMSGDAFALLPYRPGPGRVYGLCVKVLEADRVCTPGEAHSLDGVVGEDPKSGNPIIDGVEVDPTGAVVAYHVASRHPLGGGALGGDPDITWTRIPIVGAHSGRTNLLHLMEAERPGQYRGVPLVAPVIEQLKQLSRYNQAELMNAVVSGLFTVFVESDRNLALGEMLGEEQDGEPGSYALGNGSILRMEPGERVSFADPKRPNTAFESFVRTICTQVGAALEIPRDVLLKDFGQNYSASRGALLEFWKMARMRREWLTWDFCQPVYEEWMAEAVARGRIRAPGFFEDPILRRAYAGAEWHGPTTGQLDPKKEAEAAILRMGCGMSTLEREAAESNGSDWEANLRQRKREQEMTGGARDEMD